MWDTNHHVGYKSSWLCGIQIVMVMWDTRRALQLRIFACKSRGSVLFERPWYLSIRFRSGKTKNSASQYEQILDWLQNISMVMTISTAQTVMMTAMLFRKDGGPWCPVGIPLWKLEAGTFCMCRTQKYDHDGEDEGVTPVMRMMIRVGAKRLLLTGFTPFPMICCIQKYGDDAGHGRDDNGKWQRKSSLDIESLKWEYFDKSTLSIVAGNIINNHWGLLQKTKIWTKRIIECC